MNLLLYAEASSAPKCIRYVQIRFCILFMADNVDWADRRDFACIGLQW